MEDMLLADGPPPLSTQAADAALDAIDFIAAAVRGVDVIDVTDILRPLWRTHLAAWYPHLPPPTREWYANAPLILATLRAQWPLLDPWRRAALLQQWSFELPQMLWMLDPVLAQAQAVAMNQNITSNLAAMRQQAAQGRSTPADSETDALDELARRGRMTQMLQDHSTTMTNLTIGLMRSINSR
jgi:hypothetical protein